MLVVVTAGILASLTDVMLADVPDGILAGVT